jgi:hypothetical protein
MISEEGEGAAGERMGRSDKDKVAAGETWFLSLKSNKQIEQRNEKKPTCLDVTSSCAISSSRIFLGDYVMN